jgi:succinoglycan biosynthesis transport protein ExoP
LVIDCVIDANRNIKYFKKQPLITVRKSGMTTDTYEQEEQASPLDLNQILAIAKRRFFYFLIPVVIAGSIVVAIAFLLPPRYESYATVLVESQQIPVEFVQSTVTSDPNQRITVIKQRVMTRTNLLRIVDKYNVFAEERKRLSVTKLIEEMQRLVSVDVITAENGQGRRGATTIAFRLSFQHENPQTATKVANELVTLFLSENVKTRTERASETTEFLEQEAQKLKEQMIIAEAAISNYKQLHRDNLPEHLNLRLSRLERIQAEIKALEQQLINLREERRYLDVEMASAEAGEDPSAGSQSVVSDTEKELNLLKDALTTASVKLTDAHPDIKALKRRIGMLEKKLEDELSTSQEDNDIDRKAAKSTNPKIQRLLDRLQIRISSNTASIQKFEKDLTELRAKASEIEERVLKTPEVERELITLARNHREIFEKYSELQAKQGKAQLAQNLEEEKKAERFILLEPPVTPTEPVWPDRLKIFGIGGFLAIASGIGTALLVELVDKRIRTASELETLLKRPPLVSIPYIQTHRDVQKKRYRYGMVLLVPTLMGLGVLAAIHVLYKPLDVLFYRVWVYLEKLNLLPF